MDSRMQLTRIFWRPRRATRCQRGVALLAVLWLSVALTLIAMTTAYLVRTEASAVGNHVESERAAFLARGAVQAGIYAILRRGSDDAAVGGTSLLQSHDPSQRWLRFDFDSGSAAVEMVPENAKLNINQASREQLEALFLLLGKPGNECSELAAAIVEWRSPRASSVQSPLDMFYAGLPNPYQPRHAPFEELEELLVVKGMDRDLFFGQVSVPTAGNGERTPPLADLLTTEPTFGIVNIRQSAREVMLVLPGWDESLAAAVIQARQRNGLGTLMNAVPALSRVVGLSTLTESPGLSYTLTATVRMRDSAIQRSVRARIRLDTAAPMGFQVTGWWEDWPWSPVPDDQLGEEGGLLL